MYDEVGVMVAAGIHHAATVVADGSLYTWGHGRHGEPGHGNREQQTRPTQLDKTLFGRSPAVQEAGQRRQAGSARWFEEVFLAAWQSEMSPLDCQDACR